MPDIGMIVLYSLRATRFLTIIITVHVPLNLSYQFIVNFIAVCSCMYYGTTAPYTVYYVVYTEDMSKADEAVLTAKQNITVSQLETNEVGQELASLLNMASGLGLKSKVEEIRQELSQLHARAMIGAVDYAEKVSSNVMKEHQDEMEKVKEWISR